MKFKTDKLLGVFNITGLKPGKVEKAETAKMGAIQMTGVYASGGELSVRPKSSLVVSQALIDHYADVVPPKGKPTQLVIDDAYYMPDREYADAEY